MTETVGCAVDVDALRQKYAEERARRLRPDGIAQYVEIAGEFARFAEDPWVDGKFTRAPLTDEVDVAIVGAGFGGLLTGARLRQLGVESVRLIDRAADAAVNESPNVHSATPISTRSLSRNWPGSAVSTGSPAA